MASSATELLRNVPSSSCSAAASPMFASVHAHRLAGHVQVLDDGLLDAPPGTGWLTMVVVVTAWLPVSAKARSHSTVRSMGMYSGLTGIFARDTNGCGKDGHAPVLLLHHVEHLERAGLELQVERAVETTFRQQRLDGVLRRAALAVAVDGTPTQVVERADRGVVRHDVQHAEVVHADDLVAVLQLGVVVQDGSDVAGQACRCRSRPC